MDRIIRSNAVETSSQSGSLEINLQDVHPCYGLAPEMARIYGGNAASSPAVLSKLPTQIKRTKLKKFPIGIMGIGNCSTSLQKLVEQPPSALPRFILFGSLAFFTSVMGWAFTGRIEEVSQVRGKFVPLEELSQLSSQDVANGKALMKDLELKKQQLKQIQALLHQSHLAPVTPIAMTAANKQAIPLWGRFANAQTIASRQIPLVTKQALPSGALHTLVLTLPEQRIDFVKQKDKVQIKLDAESALPQAKAGQKNSILSGTITSISPEAQFDRELGWVYRVEVALARNHNINIKAGQTATTDIIYHRNVADMFLKPIKELPNSKSTL